MTEHTIRQCRAMSGGSILACGAHLKNTFCLTKKTRVFISRDIGDLENWEAFEAFEKGIERSKKLFDIDPVIIAHDLHPEYLSTKYAGNLSILNSSLRTVPIQHHHAHIASCLADNDMTNRKVIGVAFDGAGFGADGNIWGGEFLIADYADFERIAHLRYISLPGGEQAIKEPWRMAAAYLYQAYGEKFLELDLDFVSRLDKNRWKILKRMIEKRINSPLTSSMGRLFDAVSSLVGVRDRIDYEGQAAIELEKRIVNSPQSIVHSPQSTVHSYEYGIEKKEGIYIIDPALIIKGVVEDLQVGVPTSVISEKFHNTIAKMIVEVCRRIRERGHLNEVALSGGVFQNKFLLNKALKQLRDEGFQVYIHRRVPTNDAGISLGQAVAAGSKVRSGLCV